MLRYILSLRWVPGTQQAPSPPSLSLCSFLSIDFNLVVSLEMLLGAWCIKMWSISPWLSEEFTMESPIYTCEVQFWKPTFLVLDLWSLWRACTYLQDAVFYCIGNNLCLKVTTAKLSPYLVLCFIHLKNVWVRNSSAMADFCFSAHLLLTTSEIRTEMLRVGTENTGAICTKQPESTGQERHQTKLQHWGCGC